jgi:hypothetical protein
MKMAQKRAQKRAQKGCKKGTKRPTVNNPIDFPLNTVVKVILVLIYSLFQPPKKPQLRLRLNEGDLVHTQASGLFGCVGLVRMRRVYSDVVISAQASCHHLRLAV